MKKFAVIVAGGSGLRMGTAIPKQFLLLQGKPLLQHTVEAFAKAYEDLEIILVLPKAHITKGKELIEQTELPHTVHFAEGGQTRFHSVKNGLAFVSQPSIVFVHDAVRCLVSVKLIHDCYEQALKKGNAIPAVAATDSIRLQTEKGNLSIDRTSVKIIQTPQTFQSNLLLAAFEQDYKDSFTDEATVVEGLGQPVFLIEGAYKNLKITRPIDMVVAEKLLEETIA